MKRKQMGLLYVREFIGTNMEKEKGNHVKKHVRKLLISNGNRTEWSSIRSVIIRVITKSDLFITSMITDRIGRHEVLLPINHKNYNFREKKNSQVM